MIDPDLSPRLRQAVDQEMANGEFLVRLEQPYLGTLHQKIRYTRVALLAGFGAFAMGIGLVSGKDALSLALAGGGFLLAVVVFVRGKASGKAPDIAYAITDRRMVVVMFDVFGKVITRSYTPDMLGTRRVKPDDHGKGGTILLEDRDLGDLDEMDLFYTRDLRDVRATAAAIDDLVQSSSKSSL